MKLIRCKIENFGVLSDYSYQFNDELTVIHEPNGAGKSTLAVFIKAMFYGLPSKKGRQNDIDNERKRYEPWQGGNYGGFLEFEYHGIVYRVTRKFGQTAAKDICEIRDITNHKTHTGFSEKLGEDIFQIDADAFSRSLFLSASNLSLSATNSIRSKLSNLVDDTNDLNNYDTAIDRLRQKRVQYQHQNKKGGSIQRITDDIQQTDEQLFKAQEKVKNLPECEEEIAQMESEISDKSGTIKIIRQKINEASSREARLNQQKQYTSLKQDVEQFQVKLNTIDSLYPNGYPSKEEIENQRSKVTAIEQANKDLAESEISQEDSLVYEKEHEFFSDADAVRKDLDDCHNNCVDLESVSAKLTAQMLPEELNRLDELHALFHEAPPSEQELAHLCARTEELQGMKRRMSEQSLSEEETNRFRKLEQMFAVEEPTNEQIETCEKQQQEIAGLTERKRAYTLSEAEEKDYAALARTFAPGVPSEQEIQEQQQAVRRIAELTGKKNTKTTIPQETVTAKAVSKVPLTVGIVGALLVVGGILCFILVSQTPGIVLLSAGFLAILLSFWLNLKGVAGQGSTNALVIGSAISDEEHQELYDLQHALQDFLLRYSKNTDTPDTQLMQLFVDREKYLNLCEKKTTYEQNRETIEEEIRKRTQNNVEVCERFYPERPYWDGFTNDLMRKLNDYTALNARLAEQSARKEQLSSQIEDVTDELRKVLVQYYEADIQDLEGGMQRLNADAREYTQLQSKKNLMLQGNNDAVSRRDKLVEKIESTLKHYNALVPGISYTECLQKLRNRFDLYQEASFRVEKHHTDQKKARDKIDAAESELLRFIAQYELNPGDYRATIQMVDEDTRQHETIKERLAEASKKLTEFLQEHPNAAEQALSKAEPDIDYNLEGLQKTEDNLQEEINSLQTRLQKLRHEYDSMCRTAEDIPELRDKLVRLLEDKKREEKNRDLLDKTIALLERAKDTLADSYVGQIERNFEDYANKLFAGDLGEAMVDNDLQLSIGEQGKQREVGSFSTGTAEGIMLCMRMALIEALFKQERPFIMLDDPFINLDDKHTARSLDMIKNLAKEYQVIYLVCNSSRLL